MRSPLVQRRCRRLNVEYTIGEKGLHELQSDIYFALPDINVVVIRNFLTGHILRLDVLTDLVLLYYAPQRMLTILASVGMFIA